MEVTQAQAPVEGAIEQVATTQATPQVEAPKPEENVSFKFEALKRREMAARQKIREAHQLQAQIRQGQQEVQKFRDAQAKAKLDPISYLQAAGLSYEEITNFVLNGQKPSAEMMIDATRKELEDFKAQQVKEKQQEQLRQQKMQEAQVQEVLNQFQENVSEFVTTNKDKYELVHLYEAAPTVVTTVEEFYKRTGKIMSIEEATQLTEDFLREEAMKVRNTSVFKSMMPQVEEAKANQRSGFSPKTLNNQMNAPLSSAPSMLPVKTENDRLKRAMAALDGN